MAKAIMIQGTMSNSGKSFLAAALCRIFKQDGYSCAPFKSQNMALNSYITKDGLEMGRAQVMQAEAAGTEPLAIMNPILLKPTTDNGSQIIVNGKAICNMDAKKYFQYKKELIPEIEKAYKTLSNSFDIIVIEGAGSPVELNLKKDDIVNMGMARFARSPVLLTGDIDRGGIFAQLLGTLMLLDPDEQNMVKGLVVNKFRGDKSIFQSGTDILREKGGKPVAGVIPYIDCDIEDEDSLSQKLEQKTIGIIDIAVIRLPRISNFTDMDVFSQYSGVSVRYVTRAGQLNNSDMIIIPGTKSTIHDMKWLRESGIESEIKKCAAKNIPVWGICGGYQILGEKISDPEEMEGGGSIPGIGLLKTETVFRNSKICSRVRGSFGNISGIFSSLSGHKFEGYEIHAGETKCSGKNLITFENGSPDGVYNGNVYGCYVHGIFDNTEISEEIVKSLYKSKGISYRECNPVSRIQYKEKQFDIIADAVRKNMDMELIYRIINKGI